MIIIIKITVKRAPENPIAAQPGARTKRVIIVTLFNFQYIWKIVLANAVHRSCIFYYCHSRCQLCSVLPLKPVNREEMRSGPICIAKLK